MKSTLYFLFLLILSFFACDGPSESQANAHYERPQPPPDQGSAGSGQTGQAEEQAKQEKERRAEERTKHAQEEELKRKEKVNLAKAKQAEEQANFDKEQERYAEEEKARRTEEEQARQEKVKQAEEEQVNQKTREVPGDDLPLVLPGTKSHQDLPLGSPTRSTHIVLKPEEKRELTVQTQSITSALEKTLEGLSQENLEAMLERFNDSMRSLKDENIQAIERILPETDTIQEAFEVYCDSKEPSAFFTRYSPPTLSRDSYDDLVSSLKRYEVLIKLERLVNEIGASSRLLLWHIEKAKISADFLKNMDTISFDEAAIAHQAKEKLKNIAAHAAKVLDEYSVVISFNLNELLGGIQEAIANPAFINGISNELSALKSRIDRQIALIDENLRQQFLGVANILPRGHSLTAPPPKPKEIGN